MPIAALLATHGAKTMQNVAIRVEKQQIYEGLGYRWAESNLGIFCCPS